MRIIVRSNEDEPLLIGNYLEVVEGGFIKVQDDNGKTWYCGGCVVPWSTAMETTLESMTHQEQYAWLSDLMRFQDTIRNQQRKKLIGD